MQAPYRGTRGGEKARKRQFFEVSDQVRSAQRNLFRTVPWRRIEFSEATQALSQAFAAIAANPNDPSEPGWAVVATFNAALLAHLPAQQAGAPGGAAHGAPEADDDQPDPDAAAHDDQVDIGQDAEEAAPPDQAEPELEVPPRAPTEEELIILEHQILDDHLDIYDTGAEGQVQVGAEGQVQSGAVLEGAASGAPGEPGAEEEEQPEQDEYVEVVRIDSTGIWIRYSGPLSQPEPLTGAAPSAPAAEEEDPIYFEGDPYELPEEAWTNPAAFARRHTPSGIPKSAEAHDIGDPKSPPKRSAAEQLEGARENKAAVEEASPDDSVPERLPKRARADPKPVEPPRIVISKGDRPRAALVPQLRPYALQGLRQVRRHRPRQHRQRQQPQGSAQRLRPQRPQLQARRGSQLQ